MSKRSHSFVFGATPTVRMRRSKFNLSHGLKTSMSMGYLYPIDVTEVLPGDTFKMNTRQVCRLSTAFLRPVMDNAFMDVYYFYVPSRLCYDKWENVFGDSSPSAYVKPVRAKVPSVGYFQNPTGESARIAPKSIADYMGLPVHTTMVGGNYGNYPDGINVLPFRAFALIWNEWFRDENIVDPVHVQTGETGAKEYFNSAPWGPDNYTGMPPKVSKKADYFTSCLPSPQKGEAVSVPAAFADPTLAPVGTRTSTHDIGQLTPIHFQGAEIPSSEYASPMYLWRSNRGGDLVIDASSTTGFGSTEIAPDNLWAELSGIQFNYSNVNDLRMAFALQKMLEADARYGTRYREYILGHFGVSNADARMQIPEFLGGRRMPIDEQPVAQTNTQQGNISSPLGALGAYSHSFGTSRFSKSFTEHGFVITVACIRQLHTYQQGVDRMWFRQVREDYYDPKFASLGEQPVYSYELFLPQNDDGFKLQDSPVFGYNEAWADYRQKPSKITGEMRSGVANSFDVYHFGDYYADTPYLTPDFVQETSKFFDRTLAVSSADVDSFVVDFWFDLTAYRVMPTYSIPGLIDHH